MSLIYSFDQTFEKYKDKTAIDFNGEKATFGEIDRKADKIANALSKAGISKGDRVALFLSNSLELVYFFIGILKNGSIAVPMNNLFREEEAKHLLNDSGAKAVLADRKTLQIINNILPEIKGLKHIITIECDEIDCGAYIELNDFIKDASDENAKVNLRDEDSRDKDGCIIFYTSGTTGRDKGALLSHYNIKSNLGALKEAWHLNEQDKLLLALPLYHIHGLGVGLCSSFYNAYSIVLMERFAAEESLKLLQDKKCTLFMGVPAMYTKILGVTDKKYADKKYADKKYNLSSMRLFISGSAPLPAETFMKFKEVFGHEILERAGMSETGMNFSNPYYGKRKPGSVGMPLKGVQVRIVDKNFEDVASGKKGGILLKGPNVFRGYWNALEKTKESFYDSWFVTGDIGKIDSDGYVTFLGRGKDLIISGGLNIYPAEVEQTINRHPAVLESAVIGVEDKCFGEAVKAFVVLRDNLKLSEQDIINHCKKHIASFKKPKYVEFVKQLPKNFMGKVQKGVLREKEERNQ